MILKLILVLAVILTVYFMFIKKKPNIKKENKSKENEIESNEMVACETCGIYCELDDTIISNNKYYCSNECMEKA